MNLNELRKSAGIDQDPYDRECAIKLRDLLIKLRNIVQDKFNDKGWSEDIFKYFEHMGCEIKISEMGFSGDADHISLQIQKVIRFPGSRYNSPKITVYQISVPVEFAEKILVLGGLP